MTSTGRGSKRCWPNFRISLETSGKTHGRLFTVQLLVDSRIPYLQHANYVMELEMFAVLQIGRSLVRFQMVSLEFFIDIILPIALWPGVDSASNRNEYQGYFLGVKAAGA